MKPNILFADKESEWAEWQPCLTRAFADLGLAAHLHRDRSTPDAVDYIIYSPGSGMSDFTPFTNLKAVFSTWAGVEKIAPNQTLNVPLTRMVDPGLVEGMVEYCLGHILRYHLNIDAHLNATTWQPDLMPPLARSRKVGVLGLGQLGLAVADAARSLNFEVHGWSRRAKDHSGLNCHSGDDGLRAILGLAEILVVLLPLTPQTENTLDKDALALMPPGARIINPGRGPLIDDDALLAALDTGQIGHATLDVFREEPLPDAHPYWVHPDVTVTPHIAADTRAETAAHVIAENLRRALVGQPLLHLVDRSAGY